MVKNRYILAFLSILSIHTPCYCATENDFQTWLNLTVTGYFNKESVSFKRFKYWLEGQERFGDDSSRISQTLLRPGIGYALTENASLWIGYAWIKTGVPFTTNPFVEERSWEQLLWTKKISQHTYTSRTRMEQRFTPNAKTAYRARQLLKISIPLTLYPDFSFVGYDEIFWHKNDFIGRNGQGFDQNRIFLGTGYQINSSINTEIGYMNQYIRRFGVPNFLNNILLINLYANF